MCLAGLIWGIFLQSAFAQQSPPPTWQTIDFPGIPIPGKPALSIWEIPSSTCILLAQDTTIPMVTVVGALSIGIKSQTKETRGIIQVVGDGIVYNHPDFSHPDSAQKWLSTHGMLIETQLDGDFMRIRMRMPAEEWKNGLNYLTQIVPVRPFNSVQIEQSKSRLASHIQRMEAVPWYNFSAELCAQYYGEDAWKWNEVGDYPTIRKVDSAKVESFLLSFPKSYATIMVGGDFQRDSLMGWVKEHEKELSSPSGAVGNGEMETVKAGCEEWLVVENELNTFPEVKIIWQIPGTGKIDCADEILELAAIGLTIPGNQFYEAMIGSGRAVEVSCALKRGKEWGELSLLVTPNPDSLDICIAGIKEEIAKMKAGNYFSEADLAQARQVFKLREAHLREKTTNWIWLAAERKMLDNRSAFDPNRYVTEVLNTPLVSLNATIAQQFGSENACAGILTNSAYQPNLALQLTAATTPKPEELGLPDTIAFQKIYFKPNLAAPDDRSWEHIKLVAGWLKRTPEVKIVIKGFTDGIGDGVTNYHLSIERADLIKRIFAEGFGIAEDRLVVQGMGEAFPDYPDDTPEHRALNRRVTFERLKEVSGE